MAPREPLVPWSELVKDLGDLNLDEFKAIRQPWAGWAQGDCGHVADGGGEKGTEWLRRSKGAGQDSEGVRLHGQAASRDGRLQCYVRGAAGQVASVGLPCK